MCTCPRVVIHEFQDWKYSDVVPCGKCHECISKAQNEFAALAVLQAKKSKSMYFVTFTYDNAHCPVMVSNLDDVGKIDAQYFLPDSERLSVLPSLISERFTRSRSIKYLSEFHNQSQCLVPSLRRDDVALFLKRTRQAYKRKFGEYPSFTYAGFGEYGDQFHRPHYHYLFYDFSPQEINFFASAWRSDFGFCDIHEIPILNRDGSPARVKVSKYVAKYLHKPKEDFPSLLAGLCEAPRKVTSRGFGIGVLPDSLKSFTYAKI